jgi:hypothetical protein
MPCCRIIAGGRNGSHQRAGSNYFGYGDYGGMSLAGSKHKGSAYQGLSTHCCADCQRQLIKLQRFVRLHFYSLTVSGNDRQLLSVEIRGE